MKKLIKLIYRDIPVYYLLDNKLMVKSETIAENQCLFGHFFGHLFQYQTFDDYQKIEVHSEKVFVNKYLKLVDID